MEPRDIYVMAESFDWMTCPNVWRTKVHSNYIEILMATYNGEKYIADQLASIRSQTIEDWRLLISDDCSTDKTVEIVSQFAKDDPRISIISRGERFGGAVPNFYNLIHRSNASYIMCCDQDDVWNNNKIEVTLREMSSLERRYGCNVPILVSTDVEVVDEQLRSLERSMLESEKLSCRSYLPHSLVENNVIGCTLMANRALVYLAKRQIPFECIVMHDWWLNLIAQACGHSSILPVQTMKYRQHGNNVAGASYSPLDAFRKFDFDRSRKDWNRIVCQARLLLDRYANELDSKAYDVVDSFISLYEKKSFINLYRLLKRGYRCYAPLRLASQIGMFFLR